MAVCTFATSERYGLTTSKRSELSDLLRSPCAELDRVVNRSLEIFGHGRGHRSPGPLENAVELAFHDLITLARAVCQAFGIENSHQTARVTDQSGLLQHVRSS